MKITCGKETIDVSCVGSCYCHHHEITFGETDGCCNECGCPKNKHAFEIVKSRQQAEAPKPIPAPEEG